MLSGPINSTKNNDDDADNGGNAFINKNIGAWIAVLFSGRGWHKSTLPKTNNNRRRWRRQTHIRSIIQHIFTACDSHIISKRHFIMGSAIETPPHTVLQCIYLYMGLYLDIHKHVLYYLFIQILDLRVVMSDCLINRIPLFFI